jgi:filamentous hemagglutinin
VVRSCQAPLILPDSALFTVDLDATNGPLISTDPRFSPAHQAFSTQQLLNALHLNTAALPRPLGDAGYEQPRLRNQVIQLTGHRLLPGYQSDDQQQQALVTQAIAAAQVLQLTPGEPLTAEQQAQLTQDIVWPVSQSVTLADNQTLQVLALQLYTRALADTPIRSGTALISANAIQLTMSGDLHNSGTITASSDLSLSATNLNNEQTLTNRGLIDGQTTELRAHTLNNLGGGIIYGDQLWLGANTLTNDAEQHSDRKATIAARQQLKIGAQHILNQEGALIMSAGSMAVGEQLNEQQQLVGQTLDLNNNSATIDVYGDAHLPITTLNNRDLHFSTREVPVSSERHREMQREGDPVRVPINETSLRQFEGLNYTVYDYYRTLTKTEVVQHNPAKLLIGGHLNFSGTLNNHQSRFILGGTMTGPTQSIHNIDAFEKHTTTEHGTTQAAYAHWINDCFRRIWHDYLPYHAIPESRTIPLQVVVEQRHTPLDHSGVQMADRAALALQPSATTHGQLAPFKPLPTISEVTALARHPSSGLAMMIRSSNAPLILTTSGLFTIDASASDRPLMTTDPRFINYHSGFSTQHLLQELRLNAEALPRLYGDSFHEQQRVRDQVIELTGHRFLPGYHSDAQQQQALVTQGIAAARALQLTPGEPLTTAQQAQLIEAIVWPVAKLVTSAPGQTTEVLDPQIYIPIVANTPIGGLASIAASEFRLNLPGDLHNSGTVIAKTTDLTTANIHNHGTLYAEVNHLTATGNVYNRGGNCGAEKHLQIQAGQDFITQTTTNTSKTSSSHPGQHSEYSHTTLDQRAGLYVLQPQGVLEADAGRDITLTAARVLNAGVDGQTRFTAGRDITLGAVQVEEQHKRINDYHTQLQGGSRDVGSQLKAAGDISFHAGHDFTAIAAQVTSGFRVDNLGAPSLTQERDLAMTAPSSSEESLLPAELLATSSAALHHATGSLRIKAGNNVDIRNGQLRYYYDRQLGGSSYAAASQDALPQGVSLAVQGPQGSLEAVADNDMNLTAVHISNAGAAGLTTLTAGHHLTLGTQHIAQQQSSLEDADNFIKRRRTAAVGSSIQTVGDVRCQAGERFQATAAQVSSRDGAVQVAATQQLELLSGEATEDYDHATKHTEEGFFSSKNIRTRDIRQQSRALGSSFSGRQVTMMAGNQAIKTGQGHISVDGSSVVSDRQTTLVADTVSITSAENHQQQHYTRQVKKSGLFSTGGASFCIGSQRQSLEQQRAGITHNSSTVGSLQGDVTIQALDRYRQLASQVVAPEGNVAITAAELAILDAHHQQQLTQESSSSTSGFTVSVNNPALSALQTAKQLQSAVSQTSDPRMHALAAAAGGLAAKNTYDALQCNPQQLGGINVTATFGSSESHSESSEHHTTAQRSQVIGKRVIIQARTGEATIQGDVQAQELARITAAGALNLLASENHSQQESSQRSSSTAVGVGAGSSGATMMMSLSEGKGSSQGAHCRYQLAQVRAGQKVELASGGDTLAEGVVSAPQIHAAIDGNLTVESLQDSDHQQGEQRQIGINLAGGAQSISGSLNLNQSDYRSDFKSVQQQAGLKAGDQGYQLQVKGNTHLEGAVIASTAKAVTEGRNQLVTATLTQHAIENTADYDAQSLGFSQSTQPGQPALLESRPSPPWLLAAPVNRTAATHYPTAST